MRQITRAAATLLMALGLLGSGADSARAQQARSRSTADTGAAERFSPALDQAVAKFRAERGSPDIAKIDTPLEIGLVFHVLSDASGQGDISDAILATQLSVLNDAYRSAQLHFHIAQLHRYPNSKYFAGGCFPTTELGLQMKAELAVDPIHFVNIYTCRLDLPFIAGYGTLPDEFPEADPYHGVVIDFNTLPGSAAPLDLGHTLVHELGHYFGLLHTFQGGCVEPGDSVADTPAEALPAHGCQIGRDTCAQDGTDPVTNFMDYSDDSCMTGFTPLQGGRMHTLIAALRPNLLSSAFTIGPGITGNWFDPAQSGHGVIVEVLAGNQMLVDWFVFAPQGGPTWIVASGTIDGNSAVLQAFQESGSGGRFPPNFDPTQLHSNPWGTLTLTFADCNNGQMAWQPTAPGYTSGSMPITRLTQPAGLACP